MYDGTGGRREVWVLDNRKLEWKEVRDEEHFEMVWSH